MLYVICYEEGGGEERRKKGEFHNAPCTSFLWDRKTPVTPGEVPDSSKILENLGMQPTELLDRLASAVQECDRENIAATLAEIRHHNPTLEATLAGLADNFAYVEIFQLIQDAQKLKRQSGELSINSASNISNRNFRRKKLT